MIPHLIGEKMSVWRKFIKMFTVLCLLTKVCTRKKQGKSTYEKTPAPDLSAKIKPVPTIEDKTGYGSVQTRFALLKLDILDLTLFENRI